MTDEERLLRVARGDRRALEQIYDQYERLIFSLAIKIVRDPQLAEEIVQDVFVKIWTQADRYDSSRGRFSSWLINMTRNLSIDRVRAAKAKGTVPLVRSDDSERELMDQSAPELADSTVTALHVRDALASLSSDHREALELAYWQGLTHVEISRRVRVPLGTVKSRLHHALLKLRGVLYLDGREEGITRGRG
jgi:RNA polymerase sigma-70 factor (ECF subfamily)